MLNIPRTTPESVGIASEAVTATLEHLKKLDSLNSIMILRHGKCCAETWWAPCRPDLPHALYSLSKSFVSLAIGFAQAEGKLKLTDTLAGFFPEYDACITDDEMRKVTIRDLLRMATGHKDCALSYCFNADDKDWARAFLASPLQFPHGTYFAYNSAGTYMLAEIIRKVTGENVREYLRPRLFDPIGITPALWENAPNGTNKGGWGFYLTTEDLARFGQLLLQNGKLDGHQILPVDYLASATSFQIDNSTNTLPDWRRGYGYQFWMSKYGFRGDGASGQFVVVVPEQNLVVVTTSSLANMQSVLDAIWEILIPALQDQPLPENKAAQADFQKAASGLSMPLCQGDWTTRHATTTWRFSDNHAGITDATISFDATSCTLVLHTRNGEEQLKAGFGHFEFGELQVDDELPRKTASSAAWQNGKLCIEIFSYCTAFRDTLVIDFNNLKQPFSQTAKYNTFRPPFFPDNLKGI